MAATNDSPIELVPGDDRLTTFPIQRELLWKLYKQATKSFWVVEEVNLSVDRNDFARKLSPQEKHFVKLILAFFAASDKIVNINLAKRFKEEIKILEVEYFYDFQMMMENIHAEMYSLLLDTLIESEEEKQHLLNAAQTIPIIKKMTEWMYKWINSSDNFAQRLLGMACVEGIFFSGCFCAIFWLCNRGLMPGLGHSNELISRDEGLHTLFAAILFSMIKEQYKLDTKTCFDIVREAVDIAKEFINEALPINLPEMNSLLMSTYIEFVADNLLNLANLDILYGSAQPFQFMEQINLQNKTNFFERYVSNYQKTPKSDTEVFEISSEF